MTNTGIFTGGTGAGKTPLGIGVAPAVVRARPRGRFGRDRRTDPRLVVRARGRGRLFALVDLLDRLEREGRRLAAVLLILYNMSRWTARVAAELSGGGAGGKRRVLATDRTNWSFGKTAINIPMVSVIWNGVPLIWTPLPPEVVEGGAERKSGMRLLMRLL